ncbi:MAG: DUF2007 domain-containing protein [Litorimonas sp.]
MLCLIRTMNPVTLSFAQAVLKDAGIESFLFDMNASVLDGSTIIVRKRLMIIDDDEIEARELLEDAGIGHELESPLPEKSQAGENTFLSIVLQKLGISPK